MIIETERLRLRPLTLDDAPWVKEFMSDPRIAASLPAVPYPLTDEAVDEWIRGAMRDVTFAIERPEDGAVGGVVGIHLEEGNRGQIGCWCGEKYRRQGYFEEVAPAIVRYGYEELGLRVVYALRNGRVLIADRDVSDRRFPFRYDPDGWEIVEQTVSGPGRLRRAWSRLARRPQPAS